MDNSNVINFYDFVSKKYINRDYDNTAKVEHLWSILKHQEIHDMEALVNNPEHSKPGDEVLCQPSND